MPTKSELNILLQAINLVDLEGRKEVTVTVEDLLLLRKTIQYQAERIIKLEADLRVTSTKLDLAQLAKPINLRVYA